MMGALMEPAMTIEILSSQTETESWTTVVRNGADAHPLSSTHSSVEEAQMAGIAYANHWMPETGRIPCLQPEYVDPS